MAKLVAIGDSVTHGFQSFAISGTELSPPALIAERIGIYDEFRTPDFSGMGGLPFNVERMARKLEASLGPDIRRFEWISAAFQIADMIDEVENYWESGRGAEPIRDTLYHNLAVWGFEVADAYEMTPAICRDAIEGPKNNLLQPPSQPRLRTAMRVLNPGLLDSRDDDSQISIAKRICEEDGGIEHLIVALGANNVLGTVVDLEIRETIDDQRPGVNSDRNLWSVAVFHEEFSQLARKCAEIGAENIYIATVPHVTIPPITRGVMEDGGELPEGERYFDFYTRFWIPDERFNKHRDKALTKEDAINIDEHIDGYNDVIEEKADEFGWKVVDIGGLLDDIAFRRNRSELRRKLPEAISDLTTELFQIRHNGDIQRGGLFGLDGVHPTTCGHGLIADEYIKAMQEVDPNIPNIDFAELRRLDTLVSDPPRVLDDVMGMLGTLERRFHLSRWLAKLGIF